MSADRSPAPRRTARLSAAGLARRLPASRPGAGGPAYRELADRVRSAAGQGRVASGTALPSERELAAALQLSRTTVSAAYAVLREEGWLVSRQGAPSRLVVPGTPAGAPTTFPLESAGFRAADRPAAIDLGVASLPAPREQLLAAVAAATADLAALLDTDGYHPHGLPQLRERIAERYTAEGVPTTAGQVLVTSGAQHGLSLALADLTVPGDRVLLESPTYPTALDAVRAGARVPATVPLDPDEEHAWDLDLLAAVLRGASPRLGYLIPDHQNPTGAVMPEQDRERVVAAFRASGCPVVVDESFRPLGEPGDGLPPSLAAYGDAGTVLSVGSLSKPFWGGLRIGWIRATATTVDRLAAARALHDMAGPVLDQLVAHRLLADPAPAVRVQTARLAESTRAALTALAAWVPQWRVSGRTGGATLWIRLPGPYAGELARRAAEAGVWIVPGGRFGPDGTMENHFRLPVTAPPEVLTEALRRLAEVDRLAAGGAAAPRGPARFA